MRAQVLACLLVFTFCVSVSAARERALVGHWDFNEGEGDMLHDRSGNGNHGKVHGAKWVKSGEGYALQFDGVDDYVICKETPSLDITGPVTMMAWVRPDVIPKGEPGIVGKHTHAIGLTFYENGSCYWYISSGGNTIHIPLEVGEWQHVTGTFDGETMKLYVNGELKSSKRSNFETIKSGKNLLMGCFSSDPNRLSPATKSLPHFNGAIDEVRVYNRALDQKEIIRCHNRETPDKGRKPFAEDKLDRFAIEPFMYPEQNRAVLSVNFHWLLPLPKGAKMFAELAPVDSRAMLQCRKLNPEAPHNEDEAEFSLKGLKAATYELRAVLRDGTSTMKMERVQFRYPFDPLPPVASPAERQVPPLPQAVTPPEYQVKVAEGGGFKVLFKDTTYDVESSYSYSHGGENRLVAAPPDKDGERSWEVVTRKLDDRTYRVTGGGKHYSITRLIELQPSRIIVRDTIRNKTDGVIGTILSNYVNMRVLADAEVTNMDNPTIFVGTKNSGVGLIALDDLYQLRMRALSNDARAEVRDEHFGLDKGAAYTIEWAVYPIATNNYYDFINQVRKDEGLAGYVEGTLSADMSRWKTLPAETVDRKNVAYARMGCLGKPPDDPAVSLEGFEFVEYPIESGLIKKTFAESKALYPNMRVMFHVAHSLYACNNPKERFPDSRAIDANGNQLHYGPNTLDYYGKYFSKERFDEGWRWWTFYPTMENSFGIAMIEAMEYMLDDMGATGMWADGFISGYVTGGYSYDRWDGYSVIIDPKTKLITRKVTCVPWVALPVLKKVLRMIEARGGITLTNGRPGPRSLWKEAMINCCESGGGDARPIGGLHLGRTLMPLGNPNAIKNARDIYRDILGKLDFGALYTFYCDGEYMKYKTLIEHMYPITFEAIYPGTVRGPERIVTKKSGIYGWHGDRSLHIAYLYDARGALTQQNFVTTVDNAGVRTELTLEKEQSAVTAKLPITLTASQPVNVNVRQYDAKTIRLVLNGKGEVTVRVKSREFAIKPGTLYKVQTDKPQNITASADGILSVSLTLDGPRMVEIEKE